MNQGLLNDVNELINRRPYQADAARYSQIDYWCADGADCEDYAIAKNNQLVALGLAQQDARLATLWCETGEYHAVLIVSQPDGDYMLDNRQPQPVPVGDLARLGYKPHLIQKVGGAQGWAEWLTAVPA